MFKLTPKTLTRIALIAAAYSVISLILAPLSFGTLQVRVAEALTVVPLIYPPAILGLTLGCFITNLVGVFMGANLLGFADVLIGTLATLIAAFLTYRFRNITVKGFPLLALAMPVLVNGLVVGAELAYALAPEFTPAMVLIFGLDVAIGELIAVFAFGLPLLTVFKRTKLFEA